MKNIYLIIPFVYYFNKFKMNKSNWCNKNKLSNIQLIHIENSKMNQVYFSPQI